MLGSRKEFAINLVIIFITSFIGLLVNLISSIILQNNSYLYGALLGIIFVLIWVFYYFIFYKKLIFNGIKPTLINQDKIQFWFFFIFKKILIIIPFIVKIIILDIVLKIQGMINSVILIFHYYSMMQLLCT